MTEKHLDECLARLDDTRRLLDQIQTDLRGAQEFRDAVFDLLEGTPFGAQADSLYDGLYGRLRAAISGTEGPTPAAPASDLRCPIRWAHHNRCVRPVGHVESHLTEAGFDWTLAPTPPASDAETP